MKIAIVAGTGEIQQAIIYGLCRLGFNVVVTDIEVDARERVAKKMVSLGTKIHDHAMSIYEASWIMAQIIISDKFYHASFLHSKKVRFAEICGDVQKSQNISDDAQAKRFQEAVFKNLGMVPDWADRMKKTEADQNWTKIQKVLGFSAAAAAGCFAHGHFDQTKEVVSYQDIAPLSFNRNLDIIEGRRKSVWRGVGYDE